METGSGLRIPMPLRVSVTPFFVDVAGLSARSTEDLKFEE
jgi:hypothetical protein